MKNYFNEHDPYDRTKALTLTPQDNIEIPIGVLYRSNRKSCSNGVLQPSRKG